MERDPPAMKRELEADEAEQEMHLVKELAELGIDRAERYGRELDDGAAAVIAIGIARLRNSPSPRLEHFARWGHGRNSELQDEYQELYDQEATTATVRRWIDQLDHHLRHRDDDVPWNRDWFEEVISEAKEHIFVNNHKAGIGLLDVLTDWAPSPAYIEADLDRLDVDPELDASDRIRLVWLRAALLSYKVDACDGSCQPTALSAPPA